MIPYDSTFWDSLHNADHTTWARSLGLYHRPTRRSLARARRVINAAHRAWWRDQGRERRRELRAAELPFDDDSEMPF